MEKQHTLKEEDEALTEFANFLHDQYKKYLASSAEIDRMASERIKRGIRAKKALKKPKS